MGVKQWLTSAKSVMDWIHSLAAAWPVIGFILATGCTVCAYLFSRFDTLPKSSMFIICLATFLLTLTVWRVLASWHSHEGPLAVADEKMILHGSWTVIVRKEDYVAIWTFLPTQRVYAEGSKEGPKTGTWQMGSSGFHVMIEWDDGKSQSSFGRPVKATGVSGLFDTNRPLYAIKLTCPPVPTEML
jgi:hypothetical protein